MRRLNGKPGVLPNRTAVALRMPSPSVPPTPTLPLRGGGSSSVGGQVALANRTITPLASSKAMGGGATPERVTGRTGAGPLEIDAAPGLRPRAAIPRPRARGEGEDEQLPPLVIAGRERRCRGRRPGRGYGGRPRQRQRLPVGARPRPRAPDAVDVHDAVQPAVVDHRAAPDLGG